MAVHIPEEVGLSLLDTNGKASGSTARESNSKRVFMFVHTQSAVYLAVVGLSCGCTPWGELGVKPLHGQRDNRSGQQEMSGQSIGLVPGTRTKRQAQHEVKINSPGDSAGFLQLQKPKKLEN